MMNIEQIKEIKRKLVHARMTLMQCYNSFTFIEEIDLAEVKELSAEHAEALRVKASNARIRLGLRFNELFALWESYFLDYRAEKKAEDLEEKAISKS